MNDLTDPAGVAALAAGAVALAALIAAVVLAFKVRALRATQRIVLGGGHSDIVDHAAQLQSAFESLHAHVEDIARHLDERMTAAEQRLDGTIAYRALVRYDAYGEMSGHQSTSLALLDAEHNGVVLSSIAHRDTARLYCKKILGGQGEHELSPEENEAIKLAVAGEPRSVTLDS